MKKERLVRVYAPPEFQSLLYELKSERLGATQSEILKEIAVDYKRRKRKENEKPFGFM